MNPPARYVSTSLALALVAAGYFLLQARMERPGPPRPAPPLAAPRPALPPIPPTARDILDRAVALDLRGDQRVRLEALDQLWRWEISGLEATIRESEREFSAFMSEAQASRGARVQDIQQRAAEFGRLSAELRERRWHHSDGALRVLADWQRERLEGRSHESAED